MAIIEWLTVAAFVLLGWLALRLWRRLRTWPAAFVGLAFGLLALALLVSGTVPDTAGRGPQIAAAGVGAVGIIAFPYLLFRFAASLGGVPAAVRRGTDIAAALVLAVTLALVPLIATADAEPEWLLVLLLVIVVYWTALSAWVVWHLWDAGQHRPTAARRRLRALALSSGLLNVAVLVTLVGPGDVETMRIAGRVMAIAAAGGFYLAFAPPSFLRHQWRREDERRLRAAPLDVLKAADPHEAAEAVLPRVAGLYGLARAVFLDREGRPLATLGVDEPDLPAIVATVTRAAPGKEAHQEGDWVALGLRTGWLAVQADAFAPYFGSEEMELLGSVGTFIDLALERVELLAAERDARARVESASREIEALLYGVSHDLRNPLLSVLGYLDVLEADAGDRLGDDARHYIARLRANARYMDALIGDLLELSRVGRTEQRTEPVPLEPLVREIGEELGQAHPTATIEVGTLPVVDMNPVRARQLFANLLGNALAHAGRDDVRVHVRAERTDHEQALVVVADDGKGVPEAERERVFGIFEQLDPAPDGEGTGIGLAMCQRIVEQVGGRIWLGAPATGTAVHVALPPAEVVP